MFADGVREGRSRDGGMMSAAELEAEGCLCGAEDDDEEACLEGAEDGVDERATEASEGARRRGASREEEEAAVAPAAEWGEGFRAWCRAWLPSWLSPPWLLLAPLASSGKPKPFSSKPRRLTSERRTERRSYWSRVSLSEPDGRLEFVAGSVGRSHCVVRVWWFA